MLYKSSFKLLLGICFFTFFETTELYYLYFKLSEFCENCGASE